MKYGRKPNDHQGTSPQPMRPRSNAGHVWKTSPSNSPPKTPRGRGLHNCPCGHTSGGRRREGEIHAPSEDRVEDAAPGVATARSQAGSSAPGGETKARPGSVAGIPPPRQPRTMLATVAAEGRPLILNHPPEGRHNRQGPRPRAKGRNTARQQRKVAHGVQEHPQRRHGDRR